MERELAIMVGLPLSGKSTHCDIMKEKGYVIVCPDTIRLAIHGNQYIQTAEPFVWATAETMVRTLLMSNHRVIVDACNNTEERRRVWNNMANKEFGIQLNAYVMSTSYEECIKRNAKISRMDKKIIVGMYARTQPIEDRENIKYIII